MKIGISTYAWYKLPFERMIPTLARCGYGAISLGSRKEHSEYHTSAGRTRIGQVLKAHGILLESVHAPAGIRDGRLVDISDPDPFTRRHAYAETLHAIDAASANAARYVVIHPIGTKWSPTFSLQERAKWSLDSLERLQQYAVAQGVTLALENLDPPEDVMFDAVYREARELGLVYCYDNGHAFVQNDPADVWKRMSAHIRTLHLHDNDGRLDTHSSLGTGSFPWHLLRTWLKDVSYQGVIGLECRFSGTDEEQFASWLSENLKFVQKEIVPNGGAS